VNDKAVFEIRHMTDRALLEDMLRLRWSEETVFIRGDILRAAEVEGLGAYFEDRLQGVATWRIQGRILQLITINNISDRRGVSLALLEGMMALGRQKGMPILRAYLTNDNTEGMRFFQLRGFRIVAIFPGYVDIMRQLKPSLPLKGMHGIPMRDGIELEIEL
jgi:citrate lyase synthetase